MVLNVPHKMTPANYFREEEKDRKRREKYHYKGEIKCPSKIVKKSRERTVDIFLIYFFM